MSEQPTIRDTATVVVTEPLDGTGTRPPAPRATRPRSSRPETVKMHPGMLEAAWHLRREGEVMRAIGPNTIILAHPGSAAYIPAPLVEEPPSE